jgi:hypothetical protein
MNQMNSFLSGKAKFFGKIKGTRSSTHEYEFILYQNQNVLLEVFSELQTLESNLILSVLRSRDILGQFLGTFGKIR